MLSIAEQLLAYEADASAGGGSRASAASRVFDLLRQSLISLVGIQGFQVLLARSLALAKQKVPSLNAVFVKSDGVLDGFDEIAPDQTADAALTLIAELLTLLTIFIGKDLVVRILLGIWPKLVFLPPGESGVTENDWKQ